jgi:hypothetical protein
MPTSIALLDPNAHPPAGAVATRAPEAAAHGYKLFGEDGLTFDDILDILNPLHHLPVIGPLYRAATGDTISAASRITGGALFGGPIGFATSFADTLLQEASGKDAGGHILSLLRGPGAAAPEASRVTEDPSWEPPGALRFDAHEFEDWRALTPYAANGVSGTDQGRGAATVTRTVLRYEDFENGEGEMGDAPQVAAQPPASAVPEAAASKAASAAREGRSESRGTPPTRAAQAAGTAAAGLPAPRLLAADPAMVTAVRKGESPYFRPGGSLNSDAWLRLTNGAAAGPTGAAPSTGAKALTASTVAKALARYGAAARQATPFPTR